MILNKYWKIQKILFNNSLSYEAQYRQDTFIKIIANILWVGMMFLFIEVIFSHTNSIVGWSKQEIYLMTILYIIADELYVAFFGSNLSNISNLITDGDLDFYLTKPISVVYLVSCRIIAIRSFYRAFAQLLILGWFIYKFDFAISFTNIFFSFMIVLLAILIDFGRVLFANTFSFWFLRIENINDVIGSIGSFGRYPLQIWPKTLKIIFLTIIPVAFSGFMPVAVLTGRWPWYGILYALIFTILLLTLAISFWNYAVKRYSSASS